MKAEIEEITVGQAHVNTLKLNRNILTVMAVILNQKRVNVCEHRDAIFVICSRTFALF